MIYFCPRDYTQILRLDPTTNTTTLIGTVYAGTGKYLGGVLGVNGKIYFTPLVSTKILELDPITNTTTLIGNTYTNTNKYIGGVLASNNKIYFAPFTNTQILQLSRVNTPNVLGTDANIPSPLSNLPTSNYNKYYNKF